MAIEKFTVLGTGLVVYLERIPGMKALDAQLVVGVGSIDEPEEFAGASHALEHCTFLKTPSFATKQAMQEFANAHAFYKNADTYYTRTRYITRGLQPDAMFKVLGEVGLHAEFGAEAVEHEMKSVRREAKTGLDQIDRLNFGMTDYVHFGARYGRLVIGHHDKLKCDEAALKTFYDRYYKPDNMSLVVVGDISKEDIITLVTANFHGNDASPFEPIERRESPRSPLADTNAFGYIREDSGNARVSLSAAVPVEFVERSEAAEWAYNAALFILSEAVFYKMRYDLGLSYDGYFSLWDYNHRTARRMSANVTVDPADTDKAFEALRAVLARPVDSYEAGTIDAALARMSMRAAAYVDDLPARIEKYTDMVAHRRDVTGVEQSYDDMQATTAGDVRTALTDITETWHASRVIELVTGPKSAIGSRHIIDQSRFA